MKNTAFLLILLILILCGSIFSFWQGFHNQDLGYNIQKMNDAGHTFGDTGLDGKIRSSENLWITGRKQIVIGFWLGIVSALLIGYLIGYDYGGFVKVGESAREKLK